MCSAPPQPSTHQLTPQFVLLCPILLAPLFRYGCAVSHAYSCHLAITHRLSPRHEECFYFEMKQGQAIEVEFQVVSGGNLDVDYTLASPRGNIIERVSRQQDHLFEGTAEMSGDYRVSPPPAWPSLPTTVAGRNESQTKSTTTQNRLHFHHSFATDLYQGSSSCHSGAGLHVHAGVSLPSPVHSCQS
jgi:hypothetical protein